jgi:ribosomal 50S subunit-recycling heat shock protein
VRIDRLLVFMRLVKSRTLAQAVIDGGFVRVDGKRVEKSSEEVRAGSIVALPLRGEACCPCRPAEAPRQKRATATRSWELTSRNPRPSEACEGAAYP